jgi:hypothetical protein
MTRFLSSIALLIFSFFFCGFWLSAQEGGIPPGVTGGGGGTGGTEAAGDPVLEMDIKTSSLAELAAWCRELHLSEGGTKEELENRLRSYYRLPFPNGTVSADAKLITIESARTTEYFTLDVVDEEYARLRGDVILSLKDGEAVHRIRAWEILFNRTRNVMTASGGVEYVKEEGDTVETFKGESITVNLDNWSSIFMEGISERSVTGGGTAYRFAGTVISRNSEEVTVLTRAEITNGSNPDALWSLNASKLWLLPGSDWAILNAILKVGNIPVLWLPFFFFPSDEIVFHPVIGFRTREGTFVQTTTYILGRPTTSGTSENSLTKIFGNSDDMEKVREGVFLRSTGQKSRDPNDTQLSVIFDAYANLGAYLGTALALPKKGVFGAFSLSFGLGFTRNIYDAPYGNTPFMNFDGESDWHSMRFFSMDLPARYRLKTGSSLSGKYGTLSWEFPVYSDPYVDRDFMDRSEALDWLSMLRENASSESTQTTTTNTMISSYQWKLSGNVSPQVSTLSPYISSLSVSSISSSLTFTIRESAQYRSAFARRSTIANPGAYFFLPDKLNILSLNASMSGTPFATGRSSSQSTAQSTTPTAAPGDSLLPALPMSPWETAQSASTAAAASDPFTLAPPALSQRFELPSRGGPALAFTYSLSPTFGSELQFRKDNWKEDEDIDWSEISSVLSRASASNSLGLNLTHTGGGVYSASTQLSTTGSWQDYSYLSTDASEYNTDAKVLAARKRAFSQTNVNSTYSFTTSIRPLYRSTIWSGSSISYSLKGLFAKTVFDDAAMLTVNDTPQWDWKFGDWTRESLDTHTVTATAAASIMDKNQSLAVSAVLPPEEASLAASAAFNVWISETRASISVTEPYDEENRIWKPLNVTETLRFGTIGSFQQYVVYDPELQEYTTLNSTLSLSGLSAYYKMAYAMPYRLNRSAVSKGWEQYGDKELVPQSLGFGYAKTLKKENLWGKRLSFSVNVSTGIDFDLQRYTYSSLNFSLGFSFNIANFLELTFSASSGNSQIYRYFQSMPFFATQVDLPPGLETNFFADLWNSFRFDDMEKRRSSGFKLKSFNLSMVHHLGDWNAKLSMILSPYLDNTSAPPVWKFNNQMAFLMQWVPIPEIKTEVTYDKEVITFK